MVRSSLSPRAVVNFINILRAAFAPIFLHQKIQSQTVTREKKHKTLLYKKVSHKMLMKLTPGTIVFNFPYSRLNEHLRFFLFEPSASFTSSAETTKNQKFSKHYEKMTLKLNFENCEKLVPDSNSYSNI